MLRANSHRWCVVVLVLASVAVLASAAVGVAQQAGVPASTQASRKRMMQAVELTLQQGVPAKLPPHIATLLGLTKGAECPVRQGVVRSGKQVQGFDVSQADKNDVVIFFVDESTSNQTLFLTSPSGALRRVVKVQAGEGQVAAKPTAEDRKAFEKERQFWLDRLAPAIP